MIDLPVGWHHETWRESLARPAPDNKSAIKTAKEGELPWYYSCFNVFICYLSYKSACNYVDVDSMMSGLVPFLLCPLL